MLKPHKATLRLSDLDNFDNKIMSKFVVDK